MNTIICCLLAFVSLQSLNDGEEESVVQLRGFVYETSDKKLYLSEEPNLKTCCIGSEKKKDSQIQLITNLEPPSSSLAVTVKGTLQRTKDGQLVLKNPNFVKNDKPNWKSVAAGILGIGLLALFLRKWKEKVSS